MKFLKGRLKNRLTPFDGPKVSIVSAVYGVARYLDAYIESVVNQSIGLKNIELILVDDCSVDGSYEICKKWAEKYPKNIFVYKLSSNQGQGAARNFGISKARGEWVNFGDPDDSFHPNFFRHLLRASKENPDCLMFAGNLRSYYEKNDLFKFDHPLRWRFTKGGVKGNALDNTRLIHFHVNTTIFRLAEVNHHQVRFDSRVKPSFEDGLFINQFSIRTGNFNREFVGKALYNYTKRELGDSTLDGAWLKKEKYSNQLQFGYINLMKEAKEALGHVPAFIQNTIIYDLSWYIKHLANHDLTDVLDDGEIDAFKAVIKEALSYISPTLIENYNANWLSNEVKHQLIALTGKAFEVSPNGVVIHKDINAQRLIIKYVSTNKDTTVKVNGHEASQKNLTQKPIQFLGESVAFIVYKQVSLAPHESIQSIQVDSRPLKLYVNGKLIRYANTDTTEFIKIIASGGYVAELDASSQHLVDQAFSSLKLEYRDCWLLMDRGFRADDNAEHLYRYIQQEQPHINAFYVLTKDSKDWQRLEAEGFRLIEYKSKDHIQAIINCKHYLSSHADMDTVFFWDKSKFGRYETFKFHFLQHGVTKDDLSDWLNNKPIDTVMTTSQPEFNSLVQNPNYRFTQRDVLLTGFPRHDNLVKMSLTRSTEKCILIMPTWRKYLSGTTDKSGVRTKNSNFKSSGFFKNWQAFLESEAMTQANELGYSIILYPHDLMKQYIDDFELPEFVQIGDASQGSMQNVFTDSEIMITDYSSVAFEMALLRKPVMYFQFDAEEFWKSHTYKPGYYCYENDGFGPVCTNLQSITQQLGNYLAGKRHTVNSIVMSRAETFLPMVDGKSSQRVFEHIEQQTGF